MKLQRPNQTSDDRFADDDGRVVPFKPRVARPSSFGTSPLTNARSGSSRNNDGTGESGLARDLSRFEQRSDEPDDFRRRITANLAVMALLIVLTGVGIWLTVTITHLRDVQDCILSGRRDCARVYVLPD